MSKRVWIGLAFIVLVVLAVSASGSLAQGQETPPPEAPTTSEDSFTRAQEAAFAPGDVTVTKSSDHPVFEPNQSPYVTYEVTFTNHTSTVATLDRITDTLPTGFKYIGMATCSYTNDPPELHQGGLLAVWKSIDVVGNGIFKLCYVLEAHVGSGKYTNQIEAVGGGIPVGPASTDVVVPGTSFSLKKSATPLSVPTGGVVTYDVVISNTTDAESSVTVVSDTLPAGFTYLRMADESDVSQDPAGTMGTIVWTGPFTVAQQAGLHLIYEVRATGGGEAINSAVARDVSGYTLGPVMSKVTVEIVRAFLPQVIRNYPEYVPPPALLDDDFSGGLSDDWKVFTNWPELKEDQWFWKGSVGDWGRVDFDAGDALERWALLAYQGQGAEEWTDYRVEATMRMAKQYRGPLAGLWFRGTYQERFDNLGTDVTGYVFVMQPQKDRLWYGRIDPVTRALAFSNQGWVEQVGYGNEIWVWYNIAIEVRGPWMQAWIDDQLVLGWTDPWNQWTQGSVGFVIYRGGVQFDDIKVTRLDD